ncbi:MAG: NTP transferase domain-containing protein [Phycisphaerales bacterium]|nr:NTP transferase domain-containing protein [Phycisphaerales bacterium]
MRSVERVGAMGVEKGTTGAAMPVAVVLAAGQGVRMRSDLPKVVHPVGGRAMVCAVVDACLEAGCERVIVVVGYRQEAVRDALSAYGPEVCFAVQAEQLGTGHAVLSARRELEGLAAGTPVFVLCGDGPLIRGETLRTLLARHRSSGASATLATAVLDDPAGYGRVVRDDAGGFREIVEEKAATPEQRAIREVNPSYYCFEAGALLRALDRVRRNPASGEYYVTDVPALLLAEGARVEVIDAVPAEDVLSINTPEQLAEVDRVFRSRAGSRAGAGRGA